MTKKTTLKQRLGAILLALAMIITVVIPASTQSAYGAVTLTDIKGHWAEGYIKDAVNRGIVNGYPDGTFRPDASVSRAEFISMVNKALKNTASASISFNDVSYVDWFYTDVAKAVAASYVAGYDSGGFKPNNSITREEAAVIISRIVPTYGYSGNLKSYSDYQTISDWATTAVQKVNGKGYIGAYDDGRLHPQDSLTRAQTAKIICSVASGETIDSSTPTIKKDATKLTNTIYSNGVIISKDLGDGNVSINNCVILGSLAVQGGGTDTVSVSNSRVSQCTVDRVSAPVRLLVSGETVICEASADETCTVETSKLSGGTYGTGISNLSLRAGSDVSLKGDFPKVTITGNGTILRTLSGTVTTLNLESSSRNTEIFMDSNSTVTTANVNGSAAFKGKGIVNKMYINTSDVTYETKPKDWTLGSNGRAPTYKEPSLAITYSPKDGATKVAVNTKITLTFNSPILKYDGKKVSNTDIPNLIELNRKSSGGSSVEYTAQIDSARKVITITPKENLDSDIKYYIVISKNTFKGDDDQVLPSQSVYFSTGDQTDNGVSYSPRNGDTGVSLSVQPTLSFDTGMEAYDGKSVTDAYLKSSLIFKEGGSSGSTVPFTASYNSSRTKFYIYPDKALKENTKYYVGVPDKKFRTINDSTAMAANGVTWTTTYTTPSVGTVTTSSTESTVTVGITPNMAGTAYVILQASGVRTPTADQVIAGKDGNGAAALGAKNKSAVANQALTFDAFTSLTPATDYVAYVVLKTSNATGSVGSKAVKTAGSYARLDSLSVVGAESFSPGFSGNVSNYAVILPFNSAGSATINFTMPTDVMVYYNGSEVKNNQISVSGINSSSNTLVEFTAMSKTGKIATDYKLTFSIAGNVELTPSASGSVTFDPNTNNFIALSGTGTATLSFTAKDSFATITCNQLSTSTGTGSLAGSITLNGTRPIALEVVVRSNSNSKTYVYNIYELPPTTPDPTPDPTPSPSAITSPSAIVWPN